MMARDRIQQSVRETAAQSEEAAIQKGLARHARMPEDPLQRGNSLQDLGDDARADRPPALAHSEPQALLARCRRGRGTASEAALDAGPGARDQARRAAHGSGG